jgi:hypothetical protein
MSYVVDENEYDDEEDEEEEEEEEIDDEEEETSHRASNYAVPVKATKKGAAGDSKKRGKGKNKDPNRPRRNQSAFFLYCNEHRARVKANNPNISFGDVVSQTVLLHDSDTSILFDVHHLCAYWWILQVGKWSMAIFNFWMLLTVLAHAVILCALTVFV